jgi:hypothetical protein
MLTETYNKETLYAPVETGYKTLLDLGHRLFCCGIVHCHVNGQLDTFTVGETMILLGWATRPYDGERINLYVRKNL